MNLFKTVATYSGGFANGWSQQEEGMLPMWLPCLVSWIFSVLLMPKVLFRAASSVKCFTTQIRSQIWFYNGVLFTHTSVSH